MNRRKVIQHAKNYMDLLAQGVDPISKSAVGPNSVIAEPRLRKCFSFVSDILEELLANGGFVALQDHDAPEAPANESAPQYEVVRKKVVFRLSQEQRQRVWIDKASVTPNAFISRINRVIDSEAMQKLSVKQINTWLLKNKYIEETKQPTVINKTVMKPMQKATSIGIQEEEFTDPKTGEVKTKLMLTPQGQRFLLDNLDQILGENDAEQLNQ